MKLIAPLLALFIILPAASAQPSPGGRQQQEFSLWLAHTLNSLDFPPEEREELSVMGQNWTFMNAASPPTFHMNYLAHPIMQSDRLLGQYLTRMENNMRIYGRLNHWDVEMLGIMQLEISGKQALLDRLEALSKKVVPPSQPVAISHLSKVAQDAKPKDGDRRYNPDPGLWETYHVKTRTWSP